MLEQKFIKQRFTDWKAFRNIDSPEDLKKIAPEIRFLQQIIYPMFYEATGNLSYFLSDVPYIIGEHHSFPIYVIENSLLKIVFLKNRNHPNANIWEISISIRDHSFCDEKIRTFKHWLFKHHIVPETLEIKPNYEEMPSQFQYPGLHYYDTTTNNFGLSLSGLKGHYIFFELMNTLRLF